MPHRAIRQILVDVKNRQEETIIVYEVLCKDCCHVYVGETGRTLYMFIRNH